MIYLFIICWLFPMFSSYNSIENVKQSSIDDVKKNCSDDEIWIAQEKIHGSNFSAITDGKNVKWCRRNDILKPTENFNNYKRVANDIEEDIKNIFFELLKSNNTITQIQIYGELFGGVYPHDDVEKIKGIGKIQDGIFYHPDIKFIVFDCLCTFGDDAKFMNYEDLASIMEKFPNIKISQILHKGTLDELLNLDPYFKTTIPKMYDLPEIDNNYAEGYVLKPLKIACDKKNKISLKLKRHNLAERIINPEETKSKYSSDVKHILFSYLNKNRLASVLSKMTDEEKMNNELILDNLVEDAWIDFYKEHDIKVDKNKLSYIMKKYSQSLLKK